MTTETKMTIQEALVILKTGDETALRELQMPWPDTEDDLLMVVSALKDRQHHYGTCVYAMSIAAECAFNLLASKLGVTGFQASCADMDIVRRTRHIKGPFFLLDYENLLYPQYRDKFDSKSFDALLSEDSLQEWLKGEARKKLAESPDAHPEVVAHWKRLAA